MGILHQNEESCLENTSIFDTSETKCLWDDVQSECNFHEINEFNLNVIIASLLLTLTLVIPLKVLLVIIFDGVLRAPEPNDDNFQVECDELQKTTATNYMRKMSEFAASAMRRASATLKSTSTNFKKKSITLLKKVALVPQSVKKTRKDMIASDFVGMNERENRVTFVNKISSKINQYDSLILDTNLINDHDNEAGIPKQSVASIGRRSTRRRTTAIREFQEELSTDIYREFRRDLEKFYVCKSNSSHVPVKAFLVQWGIVVIDEWEKIEVTDTLFWKCTIRDSIQTFHSLEESCTDLPSPIIGSQLLRQFFIDLLGRTTKEALVFDQKTRSHYGESRIISKEWKLFTAIMVTLLNVFWCFQCIAYGSIKGYQWQLNWISLCMCSLFFLFTIEMTYEAIMISFVIPSQVLSRVRAAQAIMNTALVKYLTSNYDKTHVNTSMRKNESEFSASSYLFPSVFLAGKYPDLPESRFILSYVDPLPHNYANNESLRTSQSQINKSQLNRMNHHAPSSLPNNFVGKIMKYLTSWSIFATLVYVGSLPVLLQRCLVVVPLPFICSVVTGLILAFLRLSAHFYIPMTLLFVFGLAYGIYSIGIFTFEWIEKLKSVQEKEMRNQNQLENMLGHMATQLDTKVSIRKSSMRRLSSYNPNNSIKAIRVHSGIPALNLPRNVARRFSAPRISLVDNRLMLEKPLSSAVTSVSSSATMNAPTRGTESNNLNMSVRGIQAIHGNDASQISRDEESSSTTDSIHSIHYTHSVGNFDSIHSNHDTLGNSAAPEIHGVPNAHNVPDAHNAHNAHNT